MDITKLIELLNIIFDKENLDLELNPNAYDCGFIERIPQSETIRPTKREILEKDKLSPNGMLDALKNSRDLESISSNNQTQFMISVTECFEFLRFEDMKQKFKIRYPFKMYAQNLKLLLNHLRLNYYTEDLIEKLNEKFIENKFDYDMSIGAISTTQNRMMLASKEMIGQDEGAQFLLECRYAQFADDYLIILKHRNLLNYTMLIIPKTIEDIHDIDLNTYKDYLIGTVSKTYFNISGLIQVVGGKNLLVFGAPGTGKSHWVKENFEDSTEYIRVTFHEEYSYSDFVGTLKPNSVEGQIEYKFKEGPFSKILGLSLENPSMEYTLIIEELNRANAAAVFGDLFQILDRDSLGNSKYGIENEMISKYLTESTGRQINEIRLPSNLNIIATMNSADQGVFALDTAFKRRWNFKYIPIEFEKWHQEMKLDYVNQDGVIYEISVKDFIEIVNDYLSGIESLELNEDRLIGPYFIPQEQWFGWMYEEVFQKILNYLWDDVARLSRNEVFLDKFKQFSELCEEFRNLGVVFVEPLHISLLQKSTIKDH